MPRADRAAIAYAVRTTRDAGSARVAVTTTIAGPAVGREPVTVVARGVADLADARSRLRVRSDRRLASEGFAGRRVRGAVAITDGVEALVRWPAAAGDLFGGSWLGIEVGSLRDVGPSGAGAAQIVHCDPARAVGVADAAASAIEIGEIAVRGAHTIYYDVDVDLRRGRRAGPGRVAAGIGALASVVRRRSLDAGVWIDDSGRIRRIAFDFDYRRPGGVASVHVRAELFDFGVRARIAPPAAEIGDLAALT